MLFWPISNAQMIRMQKAWDNVTVEYTDYNRASKPVRARVIHHDLGKIITFERKGASKGSYWNPVKTENSVT